MQTESRIDAPFCVLCVLLSGFVCDYNLVALYWQPPSDAESDLPQNSGSLLYWDVLPVQRMWQRELQRLILYSLPLGINSLRLLNHQALVTRPDHVCYILCHEERGTYCVRRGQ